MDAISTLLRSNAVHKLPQRPDPSVLSESIPLFYIGQNGHGFWVAREAGGRSGGLFVFKRSAIGFARKRSAPPGCAIMILTEPFELDLENQGSRFAKPLAVAAGTAKRRAPVFANFVGMAIAEWRKLVAELSRAVASERRHRAAIERELFHGRFRLNSKNDDDLPVVE
jgi:hypothetical protein